LQADPLLFLPGRGAYGLIGNWLPQCLLSLRRAGVLFVFGVVLEVVEAFSSESTQLLAHRNIRTSVQGILNGFLCCLQVHTPFPDLDAFEGNVFDFLLTHPCYLDRAENVVQSLEEVPFHDLRNNIADKCFRRQIVMNQGLLKQLFGRCVMPLFGRGGQTPLP
jgi:hypothetical protein